METDQLQVIAHRRYCPYAPGFMGEKPEQAHYELGWGEGAPGDQKMVLLADVKQMVHGLEHAKAKQDVALAALCSLLGLRHDCDWPEIVGRVSALRATARATGGSLPQPDAHGFPTISAPEETMTDNVWWKG